MNVWIVGKGGSGKTTVAGTLARVLARGDRQVLALDLDNNPNLALSVGLGARGAFEVTAVHQHILANGCPVDLTDGTEDLVARYGVDGPDRVRLVQWSKIDDPAGAT